PPPPISTLFPYTTLFRSFGKVVEALEPGRNPARNPLFDVFVALEDQTFTNYGHAPLYMQPVPLRHDRSKFDLSFYFRETEPDRLDRKSTRLNSSHVKISY